MGKLPDEVIGVVQQWKDPELQLVEGCLNMIGNINDFYIQQKINFGEVISGGCCEQTNGYTVFANNPNPDAQKQALFRVVESSEDCQRCFCHPSHSFDLSFQSLASPQRSKFMTREGCWDKWVCCCTCSDSCQNTAATFPAYRFMNNQAVYTYEEKINNGFEPQIVIYQQVYQSGQPGDKVPVAIVECAMCFGGCATFCFDFMYTCYEIDPQTLTANRGKLIAQMVKIRPRDFGGFIREFCTDADNFTCRFNSEYDLSGKSLFKATVLSAIFFLDFMFFEYDNDLCYCRDEALHINLFNMYCNGCICPCTIQLRAPEQ